MSYWRNISPRGALADLVHEWRQPTPYRWQILSVSVAATFALMVVMIPESQRVPPPRPEVTYITTFAPGRSEADIVASNIANQKQQDEIAALRAEQAERRREAYKALGRATGLDVDAMEAEIERERAAEAAAAERADRAEPQATGGE